MPREAHIFRSCCFNLAEKCLTRGLKIALSLHDLSAMQECAYLLAMLYHAQGSERQLQRDYCATLHKQLSNQMNPPKNHSVNSLTSFDVIKLFEYQKDRVSNLSSTYSKPVMAILFSDLAFMKQRSTNFSGVSSPSKSSSSGIRNKITTPASSTS